MSGSPYFYKSGSGGGTTTFQVVVGTPQTSNGTTTSGSFAAFSNTCTITFIPSSSGRYRIYCSFGASQSTSADCQVSIVATSGSPSVVLNQPAAFNTTAGPVFGGMLTYRVDTLTAGVSYTYELQGLTSAGTLTLQFSKPTGGIALVAEQME